MKDFTIHFGNIGSGRQVEMYSYDRPAYLFWNAFCNELIARGLTERQAFEEMASKGVRWMLDAQGEMIEGLAKQMAREYQSRL